MYNKKESVFPKTKEGGAFYHLLISTLKPRNKSDRTSFRRMAVWLEDKILKGNFQDTAYKAAIILASEARLPTSKNPAAVFTSAFKEEFGYEPESNQKLISNEQI